MGSLLALPPSPGDTRFLNRQIYVAFRPRNPVSPRAKMSINISSYNPYNNTWSHVTSIPSLSEDRGLKDFAMVSLANSIYIIGGLTFCHKKVNGLTAEVDVHVTSSVSRFDLRSSTWSACTPLAVPRYEFACAICEGKIYVAGGKSKVEGAAGLTSAEAYDPDRNTWVPLPDMRAPRYRCAGVTWEGRVHVVGGFGGPGPLSFEPERSSAEVFDTRTGEWGHVAGMWQLDVPPNQIVAVDGGLFSSGDCLKVWKGHVEAYDWAQSIWNEVEGSRLQSLNCGTHNGGSSDQLYLTIAPIGTYLYFLAGYRVDGQNPKTMSIVHRFDTSATAGAWTSFNATEDEGEKLLCSHCCVVQF